MARLLISQLVSRGGKVYDGRVPERTTLAEPVTARETFRPSRRRDRRFRTGRTHARTHAPRPFRVARTDDDRSRRRRPLLPARQRVEGPGVGAGSLLPAVDDGQRAQGRVDATPPGIASPGRAPQLAHVRGRSRRGHLGAPGDVAGRTYARAAADDPGGALRRARRPARRDVRSVQAERGDRKSTRLNS